MTGRSLRLGLLGVLFLRSLAPLLADLRGLLGTLLFRFAHFGFGRQIQLIVADVDLFAGRGIVCPALRMDFRFGTDSICLGSSDGLAGQINAGKRFWFFSGWRRGSRLAGTRQAIGAQLDTGVIGAKGSIFNFRSGFDRYFIHWLCGLHKLLLEVDRRDRYFHVT